MRNKDLLTNWCREHREEQISLLKQLAAIPAPSHHEYKRAEFIRNWLYQQGADLVILDKDLNLVAVFVDGEKVVG
jgi:acetylornithine deacetylase/succinyl-diaminopimelate desuccinylase-like protein